MPDPSWTATGAGTPKANGDYTYAETINWRPAYQKPGGYALVWNPGDARWQMQGTLHSGPIIYGGSTTEGRYDLPANSWTKGDGADPPPTFSAYGPPPRPWATHLLLDGLESPAYVINPTPVFSWKFTPADGGPPQAAYQIHLATRQALLNAHTPDVWDSGIVASVESQAIYTPNALHDYELYFWAVRVRDLNDRWSEDW